MKTRLTLLGILGLFLGACSTGGYVSGTYSDDIYFEPGDVPPPISVERTVAEQAPTKSAKTMIISDIEKTDDGNTMNNYIFDGTEEDADVLRYNMEAMEMQDSDTTIYYNDDEVKTVINNYYEGDELDYAYRIRRFHNPYFYDPFYWDSWAYYDPFYYDPWYSGYGPSFALSWNRGWGYGYPSYAWGYPGYGWGYSGFGWGYPGYGWGYSGYGWGSPYYGWGGSYYGNYWGGGYYPNYRVDDDNYRYGRRTTSGAGGGSVASNVSGRNGTSAIAPTGRTVTKSGYTEARLSTGTNTRVANKSATNDSRVLTEKRRSSSNSAYTRSGDSNGRVNTATSTRTQSYTRPGTSVQNRTYTRPSTKSSGTTYTRPRVVSNSSTNSGSSYSNARSASSYNQSYRSSSTYNRSTSNGSSSRSYRAPTPVKSSGSSSYSRSSSSNSRSSGSSYSSGSSRSSGSSYSSGSSRSSGSSSGTTRSSSGGRSGGGRR